MLARFFTNLVHAIQVVARVVECRTIVWVDTSFGIVIALLLLPIEISHRSREVFGTTALILQSLSFIFGLLILFIYDCSTITHGCSYCLRQNLVIVATKWWHVSVGRTSTWLKVDLSHILSSRASCNYSAACKADCSYCVLWDGSWVIEHSHLTLFNKVWLFAPMLYLHVDDNLHLLDALFFKRLCTVNYVWKDFLVPWDWLLLPTLRRSTILSFFDRFGSDCRNVQLRRLLFYLASICWRLEFALVVQWFEIHFVSDLLWSNITARRTGSDSIWRYVSARGCYSWEMMSERTTHLQVSILTYIALVKQGLCFAGDLWECSVWTSPLCCQAWCIFHHCLQLQVFLLLRWTSCHHHQILFISVLLHLYFHETLIESGHVILFIVAWRFTMSALGCSYICEACCSNSIHIVTTSRETRG